MKMEMKLLFMKLLMKIGKYKFFFGNNEFKKI